MKAGVFGIGAAVPHDVITNAHLEGRLDTTDEWIVKRTGIQQRHWLNGTQTLADLAVDACAGASALDHARAVDAMALYAPLIELTSVDEVLASLSDAPLR